MWHVALGLGILITAFVLKPFYFSVFFQSGMTVNADYYRMQKMAEICLAVGLVIGWYLERRLALKTRLPHPVPGYWALKTGVWMFFLVWVISIASRTIPYAVYWIGAFPSRYLIQSQLPGVMAIALVLYGLARVFLCATPSINIRK